MTIRLDVSSKSCLRDTQIERVPTGIAGFDEMIEGGIPAGRTIIVIGGPGTGKTIFCAQFLNHGITKYGQKGLYVSLEERRSHLYREMCRFNWNLVKHEKEGKLAFIDATPSSGRGAIPFRSLEQVLREILRIAAEIHVQRIAVDGIASLLFEFPNLLDRRRAILRLVNALSDTGATTVLTNELSIANNGRPVQLEEYLTHGTVILQTLDDGSSSVRALQIEKMRETTVDPKFTPYLITSSGIEVLFRRPIK